MFTAAFLSLILMQEGKTQEPPKQEPPKASGFEILSGDWKLKIYGFLRTDMLYDDSRPNNTQTIGFVRSEDRTAGAAFGSEENSEDLTIHARLTRIGIDIGGPAISKLGNARILGKMEVDFYNNGLTGQSESRAALRMRHAFIKLSWDELSLLAGQTTDIISPIFPAVNADMVMWGAGNLGDRRPMFMADYRPKMGNGTLIAQVEVGLTGADDNANIDSATSPTRDGEASGKPTLQGRLAYKGTHFWLEKKTFELGAWGHWAAEHLDTPAAGEDDFTSTAFGVDLTLPVWENVDIRGELWSGKNVDDVRGGIFQGINATLGEEIESRGYWAEVVWKAVDWYTLHVGVSADNPQDEDVADPTATTGAQSNKILYVANRFNAGGGLSMGVDLMNWTTKWSGGFDEGTDNRFNFFVQWNF